MKKITYASIIIFIMLIMIMHTVYAADVILESNKRTLSANEEVEIIVNLNDINNDIDVCSRTIRL